MHYKISGVDSIIIYFGDSISKEVSEKVLSYYKELKEKSLDGIIEIVPSYTTIFIQFDIFKYKHEELFKKLKEIFKTIKPSKTFKSRFIEIPVYYDLEVGLDLERVAKLNKLGIDEVIKLHSSKTYRVYSIGFAPGFSYMGEVDKKIKTPRLSSPRAKIPKGSVALADIQTAIYPSDSPGGWNILGRTYIEMFDKKLDGFSYLNVGDSVKFTPITKEQFLEHGGKL